MKNDIVSLKERALDMYSEGTSISTIAESLSIDKEDLYIILSDYRKECKHKNSFSDEFKKIISFRDVSGVSRRKISEELGINQSTVKKACIKFGNAFKNKAKSEYEFTELKGVFDMNECPSCKSKKINFVEENNTYCLDCGDEFVYKEECTMKVNWEYLD